MIDVYVEGLSIDIGRQGENLARNIYFDLSELISTYGEGTATLVYVRPSDKAPYVCTIVRTGTFLIWSPTSTDTAYSGVGKCELRWTVGETLAKSIVYNTSIAPSIMQAGQIPDPYLSWYDTMMEYIKNNYADGGVPSTVKNAIFTLLSKAAYTETGLTDELATVEAWTDPECTGLTLSPSRMSFDTVSAQRITATRRPADCTQEVTWTSSDETVATVTIRGDSTSAFVSALKDGTCTITATCGNQTATCAVTVYGASVRRNIAYNLTNVLSSNINWEVLDGSAYTTTLTGETGYVVGDVLVMMSGVDITDTVYSDGVITIPSVTGNVIITASGVAEVVSLSAVYTQSGTVYDFDSLDSLKDDLVVTATYSDSTTATVPASGYTLSGTLEAGTSTVTVSFGGATATFNVTVTQGVPSGYTRLTYVSTNGNQYVDTGLNETQTTHAEYEVAITSQPKVNGNHILSSTNTYFPFLKGGGASDADWKTRCGGRLKGNETFSGSGIAVIPFSWELDRRYIISGYPDTVIDGVTYDSLTAGNTASTSNKLTLFTYGGAATNATYRFHGRMYWCKIYDSNDDLLRYFIPAKNSSNVAGLYDVINGTFYTSATGTALIAGEVA